MTNLTDRDYVALTLLGECRGEPTLGKLAVASVLRNRKRSGQWGDSYERVCLARKQFSCWNAGDPNRAILDRLADQIRDGVTPTGADWRECAWIADGLIADAFPDLVKGAKHYFATWLPDAPAWAKDGQMVASIGQHIFMAGVK